MTRTRLTGLAAVAALASAVVPGVAAAATAATAHPVSVTGKLVATKTTKAGVLAFKGTATGTGGTGKIVTSDKILSAGKAIVTSTTTYKNGTETYIFNVTDKVVKKSITITGTGRLVKGTGIYKKAHATGLHLTGTAPLTLKTATVKVTGTITY